MLSVGAHDTNVIDIATLEVARKAILSALKSLENDTTAHPNAPLASRRDASSDTGEGTLLRLPVRIGEDDDGTPIYQWVHGKTQDALCDAVVKTYIQHGRIDEFTSAASAPKAPANSICFKEYAQQWFGLYKTGIKETSKQDYSYILNRYLYPKFGERLLHTIHTSDIQMLLNEWSEIARSTINKMLLTLDQIFRSAVKDKLITENPVDKDRLMNPSKVRHKRDALLEDDFQDIVANLHKLQPQDRRLIAMFAFTGMRRGEVLGARWEDIDTDKGLVHVRRNIVFTVNDPILETLKSESGYRSIPLNPKLLEILAPDGSDGYIIGGEKPITKSSFSKTMMRINRTIDLHSATAHIFRHTFATFLNAAGVDPKTIQYIMGHSDISTTMNRYTHMTEGSVIKAGTLFSGWIHQ